MPNTPKYTTVLWDLDGTVLDSGPGIFDSFRKTFDAMGMTQPTDEQLRAFVGPPLMTTFNELLGLSPDDSMRAFEMRRRWTRERRRKRAASRSPMPATAARRSGACGRRR
jgi:phosphoglycolate phosphatase